MLAMFSRIFQSFREGPSAPEERGATLQAADLTARLAHLEGRVEEQKRQLAEARLLLQQSAHLARYHQPSLEREIRNLLAELKGAGGPLQGKESKGWKGGLFRKPERISA